MPDWTGWMPADMPQDEKDHWAQAYPDDPHGAAAAAWESWAATLQDDEAGMANAGVRSVSTGAQSVTYDGPRTASGQAAQRARWHRARSRPYSVDVGPTFGVYLPGRYPGDYGTIPTYISPPMPPTEAQQVNLPQGVVPDGDTLPGTLGTVAP